MVTPVNLNNLGEVEVSYKYKSTLENRLVVKTPEDALNTLRCLFHTERMGIQEQFIVIFLNRANMVIGSCNLFKGSNSACVVDVKLILAVGLKLMANSVIISHNHPSGNLKPSSEDISLTKKIQSALDAVEMSLLDHLIVSPDFKYLAFSEEGLF